VLFELRVRDKCLVHYLGFCTAAVSFQLYSARRQQ
jgi:hypothetical protein